MDDPAPPKKLRAATQENRKRIDSIIRDYLNNWAHETHDLVLGNVTPHDLSHFQRALKGRLGDKLYYEYDAEGGILTLKSSNSSPFTVAIQEVLSSCFLKIGAAHPDENRIEFYRKVHHLPPRAGSRDYSLKVADASTDEDIKEVNCMQDLLPNVVLEVAFTQSYESVVEDARQWLVKSLGAVRLAIVVKFKEGAINNPGPGLGVASGSSNQGPVKPLRSQASPGSSRAVVPEEWVGPIVGFMEIWRYDSESSSIFIDHPRVEIFPTLNTSIVPHLKASDIFKEALPTDPRTFSLDFSRFQSRMQDSIKRLAHSRMVESHWGAAGIEVKHEFDPKNFQPSDSESEAKMGKKGVKTNKGKAAPRKPKQVQKEALA